MLPLTRPSPIRRTRVRRSQRPSIDRSPGLGAVPHLAPPTLARPDRRARDIARTVSPPAATATVPDGRWLRVVLIVAPTVAIGIGVAGVALSLVSDSMELLTALVVPLAIIGALALGDRPAPRLAAALALDVEALLTGAVSPAGMAFAPVLPLIAVGLVQPLIRGRALLVIFGLSAVTAVLGMAEAVTIDPARGVMPPGSALLTVVSFAAVTAFALALNWRATRHLSTTLAAAETEIRERATAEGRLRETSEILSAILTSSPVATQAFDRNRKVIVWNPASERTFGWTAEEVVGRSLPEEMIPLADRVTSRERIMRTLAGSVTNGDRVRRLTKDGDERWVDIYAAPLLDHDGSAIGIAGQMVDVTDRVRMEAQLLQAQKMGAVGLLASGIAHDFNNTLTAARGYAELIRNNAYGPTRTDVTTLIEVVDRGRQLTRQLLDFARRGDGKPGEVDVRDVVTGIEPLIRRTIGGAINVEVSLAAGPLPASIHVGQLEQSLINLAINARDAMPGGGRLRITAGTPAVAVEEVAVSDAPGADPAQTRMDALATVVAVGRDRSTRPDDIEIVVADNGVGIPESVMVSVFEPFFTTKPVGVGTGLGLAMVRGFVEAAGGALIVTSEVGVGTSFTIRLPRAI
jgi:PAS domain S-box-containing protein